MALPVAIQSVVFYYLACTPCMSARTRHRAKKKFDEERKARAALEEDEPPLYRHPSPFNVNPYWQEEIMMGPSLPKKGRAAKQNSSQRKLTSAGKDSSIATRSSLAISNHGGAPNTSSGGGGGILQGGSTAAGGDGTSASAPGTAGISANDGSAGDSVPSSNNASGANVANSSNNSNNSNDNANGSRTSGGQPPSSPTLIPDDARSMSMLETTATAATAGTSTTASEGWNFKRYQREDEELWGSEPSSRTHKLIDAIAKASSSAAGRLLESTRTLGTKDRGASSTGAYYANNAVTDQDRANFYSPTIIHPPVNDYHPPVVGSKPAHKDALRWMLQPPPPAKVMEGKVPVSRSTSVASSINGGSMRRSMTNNTGAGSEVSLARRKAAMEARLRRADSATSGATVTGNGRPHASSSTSIEEDDAAAIAAAAATANLSRTVSRKSTSDISSRPKSQQQQRLGSRGGASAAAAAARSRSGSLASSVEDPTWSSDDNDFAIGNNGSGILRSKWRFPGSSAPPPMPAIPSMPSMSALPAKPATAVLPGTASEAAFAASSRSSLQLTSQNPSRAKLETILSSDASGKMDMSSGATGRRSSSNNRKASKERKENTRLGTLKSAMTSTSTVVAVNTKVAAVGDATKSPTGERSAGSSLDSGMALSS